MAARRSANAKDVSELKRLLSGTKAQVFGPADEGYTATLERWSRAAEKPAGISVVPTTNEEVSVVVKYASENNLDLTVKGGGKMCNVKVDADSRRLYIQGGASWADVDQAAWTYKLATVGGTVAETGAGGLILGGGDGHMTARLADMVLSSTTWSGATVVLVSDEIKKTSETENSISSGHCSELPQDDVCTGMMVFVPTPDNIRKIVDAANDLYQVRNTATGPQTKAKGRCSSLLALAKPPPAGGQTMILVMATFLGSEEEGKKALKGFLDVGPVQNTMAMHPYPIVNTLVPAPIDMRASMKGAAFVMPIRPDFVLDVMAKCDEFLGAHDDAVTSLIAWELYDSVKVTELSAGSYANRGYHMNGLILPTWSKKENEQVMRQWARDVSNMFKTELQAHGEQTGNGVDGGVGRRGHKGAVMLYGNIDQYDEISKDIFGENYERLQEIKAKYDPKNMFDKLFAFTSAVAQV